MPTDIWERFSLTKDINLRNILVSKYLYLVKIVVCKLIPLYRNHVEYDDFFNFGILGLIDAIEKYDYTKGTKFETYGSIRIRGAIIDNVRGNDWLSTYLRHKLIKVERAYEYLECLNGRSATEEEVADYLNMDVKELKSLLVDYRNSNVVYFDELKNPTAHLNAYSESDEPEECYERKETKEILINQIRILPAQEKTVITLYYFKGLRLKEIGAVLGVSESRVSQIHSNAIARLKSAIVSVY